MVSSPPLKRSVKIYSGSGNLFLIVTSLTKEDFVTLPEEVDGILLHTPPTSMRIFNRDASEASMCGNGLRCFVRYLIEKEGPKTYTIQTPVGELCGWQEPGGEITTTLPTPSLPEKMVVEGVHFTFLNTGVPHAVCTGEIADFATFGRHFVYHSAFGPEGSNITHYRVSQGKLYVQTFERGVDRITGACGTGSVAAALLSGLPSPIQVISPSGECLTVTLSPLTLRGKVTTIEKS